GTAHSNSASQYCCSATSYNSAIESTDPKSRPCLASGPHVHNAQSPKSAKGNILLLRRTTLDQRAIRLCSTARVGVCAPRGFHADPPSARNHDFVRAVAV